MFGLSQKGLCFLTPDRDFAWRGDAQADAAACNFEHYELYVFADHHDFSWTAGQDEHVHCLLRETL